MEHRQQRRKLTQEINHLRHATQSHGPIPSEEWIGARLKDLGQCLQQHLDAFLQRYAVEECHIEARRQGHSAASGLTTPTWPSGNRSTTLLGERHFIGGLARNLAGRELAEIRRAALGMQLRLTPAGIGLAERPEREADAVAREIDWARIAGGIAG